MLSDLAVKVGQICNGNESCGKCPLKEYQDLCDVINAEYTDEEELKKLDKFERIVQKEMKRAAYRKELIGKEEECEDATPAAGS